MEKYINLLKLNTMLQNVQKPLKYVGGEYGLPDLNVLKAKPISFCLCFADTYEIGMSNLGNKILIDRLLAQGITRIERSFMPSMDFISELNKAKEKLFSLETKMYLNCFDAIGFSLGYELCLTNMVKMMMLSDVQPFRKKRKDDAPIIVAGGPVCFNPSTVMDFCDVILVADGELNITQLASCLKEKKEKNLTKMQFLKLVKEKVDGAVVPAFFSFNYKKRKGKPEILSVNGDIVKKAIISKQELSKPLNHFYVPSVEIVQDKTTVEVFRGCTAGCRFCQAGFCYRPNREKDADVVVSQAKQLVDLTGYDEVTLSSLSTGDYTHLKKVVCTLDKDFKDRNIEISLPSLRVDSFEAEMVSSGRKGNITFAPEAGSDRLRKVINKNITEEEILKAMENAAKLGYTGVKLYFMLGLPTETFDDVSEIKNLAIKIKNVFNKNKTYKRNITVTVSTSVFIPKPFTPFAWEKFADKETIFKKQSILKETLKKENIRYIYHGYEDSLIECFLSRGGPEISKAIYNAVKKGQFLESETQNFNFTRFEKAIQKSKLDLNMYAAEIDEDEILPWDIVDMGVSKKFLLSERAKSREACETVNCKKECQNCGMLKLYNCMQDNQGDK